MVRCIGQMYTHLGIVAQVLQQLTELLVQVRNRLVVDIVIGHQRKEIQAFAGVRIADTDNVVERIERVVLLVEDNAVAVAHKPLAT